MIIEIENKLISDNIVILEFDLTDEMIANGIAGNCRLCPFALALRPHIKGVYWIKVTKYELELFNRVEAEYLYFDLGMNVSTAIGSFDRGNGAIPGKYRIKINRKVLIPERTGTCKSPES